MTFLSSLSFFSCKNGGAITDEPIKETVKTFIETPTVVSPSSAIFYSKENEVLIEGVCQTGFKLALMGAKNDETVCENSKYSFKVRINEDGVYSLSVTQYDSAKNPSQPANFVWVHKSSIAPALIQSPSANNWKSASDNLILKGTCENLSIVRIVETSGSKLFDQSAICLGSAFEMTVTKLEEGTFNFQLIQTDQAKNSSILSYEWKKQLLRVSPTSATLVVASNQSFGITGGSEIYSIQVLDNQSGGSFNSVLNKYAVGTLAGKTDTVRVIDSLGSFADVKLTTVADVPDHFEDVASSTSFDIGTPEIQFKTKVVDRYGNGIANYPVNFRSSQGDHILLGSLKVVTDINGIATISSRAGFQSKSNRVSVSSTIGILPDLANSGKSTQSVNLNSTAKNSGKIGNFFEAGAGPGKFVFGDFNNDGKVDIAILNTSDPSIGIFLSKGNGLFEAMIKVQPVCVGLNGIVSGQFNNDGFLDLVILCGATDKFAFLKGKGDGTFYSPVYFSLGVNQALPVGIVSADFNNDGKLDLAIINSSTSVLGIWSGDGNGNFSNAGEYALALSPSAISLIDVNKDSKFDLVVTSSGTNVFELFTNNGNGSFNNVGTFPTGNLPLDIASADFNGDGFPDVVVANSSDNTLSVYLNDHSNSFQLPATVLPTGSNPVSIATLDFDENNKVDITVVNSGDNTLYAFKGQGDGTFIALSPIQTKNNPIAIGVMDVNSDGKKDLIAVDSGFQTFEVLPANMQVDFGYRVNFTNLASQTVVVDYDNDGKNDLLLLQPVSNTLSLLKGLGNGLFTDPNISFPAGLNPTSIILADVNGDKILDFIVTSKDTNVVKIYLGTGTGFNSTATDVVVGVGPTAVAIEDVNGDGVLDIITSNSGTSTVSVLLGNSNGTFQNKIDYQVGSSPIGMKLIDLNGDNKLDIVTVNNSAGTISVLIGNGNGTFQSAIDYSVGNSPTSIVVQDLSNDGKIDIAVTNAVDGTVSILLGNGDGSFQGKVDYACGATPSAIVTYVNKTANKVDLVINNGAAKQITILRGDGNGQFGSSESIDLGHTSEGLTVGDFNNDGIGDLVIPNTNDNGIVIWLGH